MRRRVLVLAAWCALALLGLLGLAGLPSRLTTSIEVPGTPSAAADASLARHLNENVDGSFTVVRAVAHPTSRDVAAWRGRLTRALSGLPGARVTQSRAVGGVWYAEVDTPYPLSAAARLTAPLRARVARADLPGALVTGAPAIEHDLSPVLQSDLRTGLLVALVAAVALLALLLGLSGALLVPLVVAGLTTSVALLVVELLARRIEMVLYVPNVVELVGLGLAVDYSLLLVHRLRQEHRRGAGRGAALEATMASAGRTVATSGTVVALGLAALLLEPVGFVRSLGIAALAVAGVAVAAAFTLQPAILSLLGPRGLRAAWLPGLLARDPATGLWAALARAVLARRRAVLAGSALLLAVLALPVAWLHLTPTDLDALPATMPSARAIALVSARLGPGVLTPIEVVVDTGRAGGARAPAQAAARLRLAREVLTSSQVELAAIGSAPPFVSASGRYEQVDVVARAAFGAPGPASLVATLRTRWIPRARFPAGTTVEVGGATAQGVDFLGTLYGAAPWLAVLSLGLVTVLLALALGSLPVALLSTALALVSQVVALGVVVAVFRFGVGSALLHTYRVGQIEGWVPVFLYALLFGLSTDYQVFIVARAREAYARLGDPDGAIVEALSHTGGVVSAAALVMVGALGGLVVGHAAGLQELGVGLAAGVLADALVVRALVLPSALGLLGRRAWPGVGPHA